MLRPGCFVYSLVLVTPCIQSSGETSLLFHVARIAASAFQQILLHLLSFWDTACPWIICIQGNPHKMPVVRLADRSACAAHATSYLGRVRIQPAVLFCLWLWPVLDARDSPTCCMMQNWPAQYVFELASVLKTMACNSTALFKVGTCETQGCICDCNMCIQGMTAEI